MGTSGSNLPWTSATSLPSTVDAVEVTEYAVANGADIRNNSWGSVGSPSRDLRASTVDLVASGVNVLTTLPANRYGYHGATSMATPHATRVAALIKSQQPALGDAQLRPHRRGSRTPPIRP